MREFGVPAVGIVDVDIVKDAGTNWTKWMQALRLNRQEYEKFRAARLAAANSFAATKKEMKKDGGINLLEGQLNPKPQIFMSR